MAMAAASASAKVGVVAPRALPILSSNIRRRTSSSLTVRASSLKTQEQTRKALSLTSNNLNMVKKMVSAESVASMALVAALVIPEVAEAAQPGLSPSLKNYLFSVFWGSVIAALIAGAVTAVSFFDPVKRN